MRWREYLLPSVILLALFTFIIYPTLTVAAKSLTVDGQVSFANYAQVLTSPYLRRTIVNSLPVSIASAAISTLLGLIIALVVFKTDLPGRPILGLAAVLPMIIPGFANTLAYIFLFGRNGLITYKWLNLTWDIYSWRSVLILQSLALSTTFLLISSVLIGVDSRVEDAARNLGSSEWKVLTSVTLPLIRPGLIGAALLAFLRSMADFSTPYLVGGKFNTLATASYTQLIGTYNTEMASTLSMILLLICTVAFWLYTRAQAASEKVRATTEGGKPKSLKLHKSVKWSMWTVSMLYALLTFMLLGSVFLAAFSKHLGGDSGFTMAHFEILPQRGWNSTRNTILFATVTSVIVSSMGIVMAYLLTRVEFRGRSALDLLATLPYAIPGTFMGIGYALAFSRPPLVISGTWAIVIACTVIRELPMGLRAGVSVLMQQDRSVEDAAANLGASKLRAFRDVIIPAARPALVVTSLYAFIATVKTLGAIIFLITPSNKVLSADIFEATVRGEVGDASALSIVVIVVAAIGMLAIYAINSREAAQEWIHNALTSQATG
jgi:iron(III) transport system permease protein